MDLSRASLASQRLALTMRERLGAAGVNLLNCCEPAAWQTVFHLHFHVIPRYDDDPLQLPVRPSPRRRTSSPRWRRSSAVAERARLERDGDLGILVIDDPPLNLFGDEMVRDIQGALDATDGLRALLVRAEGEYFTGGADVHVFEGLTRGQAEELTAALQEIAHRIEDLPFPTLASVHGLCLTAGLELSLACDMIWASESASFGLVEAVVGLTPLMGGTQRMAERAGPARAREFVMERASTTRPRSSAGT